MLRQFNELNEKKAYFFIFLAKFVKTLYNL